MDCGPKFIISESTTKGIFLNVVYTITENMEQEKPEQEDLNQNLWLTERLLKKLSNSARIGKPLMVVCLLLGLSTILKSLHFLYTYWAEKDLPTDKFYLLEGGNLFRVISLLVNISFLYLCTRGIYEGYKAWSLLRHCETDDQALLEGSERLGKMFRWMALGAAFYLTFPLLENVWSSFATLMSRPTQF